MLYWNNDDDNEDDYDDLDAGNVHVEVCISDSTGGNLNWIMENALILKFLKTCKFMAVLLILAVIFYDKCFSKGAANCLKQKSHGMFILKHKGIRVGVSVWFSHTDKTIHNALYSVLYLCYKLYPKQLIGWL